MNPLNIIVKKMTNEDLCAALYVLERSSVIPPTNRACNYMLRNGLLEQNGSELKVVYWGETVTIMRQEFESRVW